jgi:MerR family redox-sensitive transcriptional activator SoxR
MTGFSISDVARRVGLRPSAIRYYEQIGILPPAKRVHGQRRYDRTILAHLVLIHHARQNGFTLADIRELLFGFNPLMRAGTRWQKLSERKLAQLEASIDQIRAVQDRLSQLRDSCHCKTLAECGEGLLLQQEQTCFKSSHNVEPKTLNPKPFTETDSATRRALPKHRQPA